MKGHYEDTENVRFFTEPEITAASATFKGSYAQFSDVYASLAAWISENGYEFTGPMIDVYHVSPNEIRNPEEFVTEICCRFGRFRKQKIQSFGTSVNCGRCSFYAGI